MSEEFPTDLRYTESDEWVRREGDEVVIGITSYASEQLGDVVYLQLPEVGGHVDAGGSFGEIESVKAVSELYAPLAGEITAVNTDLDGTPGLVNDEPYGRGWIARLRPDDHAAYEALLDAGAYQQHAAESH